ncbi:MAG: hypothetical protein O2913_02245 [Chloroflexi bacterium]|nr:hypothetical protein [Chloroflexota bacterium]
MDAEQLVDRLRRQGVAISIRDGELRLVPGSLVPGHLVKQVRENKSDIYRYLQVNPPSTMGTDATTEGCWPLELWRRLSRPEWRQYLRQSIENQDKEREEHARWMLREILPRISHMAQKLSQ